MTSIAALYARVSVRDSYCLSFYKYWNLLQGKLLKHPVSRTGVVTLRIISQQNVHYAANRFVMMCIIHHFLCCAIISGVKKTCKDAPFRR